MLPVAAAAAFLGPPALYCCPPTASVVLAVAAVELWGPPWLRAQVAVLAAMNALGWRALHRLDPAAWPSLLRGALGEGPGLGALPALLAAFADGVLHAAVPLLLLWRYADAVRWWMGAGAWLALRVWSLLATGEPFPRLDRQWRLTPARAPATWAALHAWEAGAAVALPAACALCRWLLRAPLQAAGWLLALAAAAALARLMLYRPLCASAERVLEGLVPRAAITVHDRSIWLEWLNCGLLAMGDSFVAGQWEVASGGTLEGVVEAVMRLPPAARAQLFGSPRAQLTALVGRAMRYQPSDVVRTLLPLSGSTHGGLDARFFGAWLDERWLHHATCLFAGDDDDLEAAAEAHLAALADALAVDGGSGEEEEEEELLLLDIAAGWGAFPVFAARRWPALRATGVVAAERVDAARQAAARAGVADRVVFIACDFAAGEHRGRLYDRVACSTLLPARSFHAAGDCLRAARACLAPGGRAVLHTLVAAQPLPTPLHEWTSRYALRAAFPSLAQLAELAEGRFVVEAVRPLPRAALERSMREWGRRFQAAVDAGRVNEPPSVLRVWQFHFATGAEAAATGSLGAVHLELSRDPVS